MLKNHGRRVTSKWVNRQILIAIDSDTKMEIIRLSITNVENVLDCEMLEDRRYASWFSRHLIRISACFCDCATERLRTWAVQTCHDSIRHCWSIRSSVKMRMTFHRKWILPQSTASYNKSAYNDNWMQSSGYKIVTN
jgi:hypothetical protein